MVKEIESSHWIKYDEKRLYFSNFKQSIFFNQPKLYIHDDRNPKFVERAVDLINEMYMMSEVLYVKTDFSKFHCNFTCRLQQKYFTFIVGKTEFLHSLSIVLPFLVVLEARPEFLEVLEFRESCYYVSVRLLTKMLEEPDFSLPTIAPPCRTDLNKDKKIMCVFNNCVNFIDFEDKWWVLKEKRGVFVGVNKKFISSLEFSENKTAKKIFERIAYESIKWY